MKIVVLDGFAANPGDLSWEGMQALGELTVYDRTAPEEVMERCNDADIVLTNKVILSASTLKQLPQLKYIGVLATGYNVVDIKAARKQGIVVTNIPAYSTDSVAQLTFAHILNITNRVGHYARQNREGRWSRNPDFVYWDTPLIELNGKTLGIVGLGNIGMKVATIARQFGMDVFAMTSKNSSDLPAGIQKTTFEGLLAISDVLSLHCPLTEQTRHLMNAKALKKMKPGAILINTGRGPLVDEQAVADALQSGQLLGYGADVMSQEPPQADNPLLQCPNAFLTPHIAWATFEARQRLMQIAIDNVQAFLKGKPINVVN
jgi:glycerate dehydrogenase